MTATLVGAGALVTGTSGTTFSPTWPTSYTPTAGHVAYLHVASNANRTFTAAGWTSITSHSGSSPSSAILYKVLAGGESAPTVTVNSALSTTNVAGGRIYVWSGVDNATPHEDATGGTGTSATPQAVAVTTTGADRVIFAVAMAANDYASTRTGYPPATWTSITDLDWNFTGDAWLGAIYRTQATATTTSVANIANLGESIAWRSYTLALISGGDPEPPDPAITHAVVGGVTTTTAKIRAKLNDVEAATLNVSTSSGLTSPIEVVGTNIEDLYWAFDVTGLAANTLYYYGFETTAHGSFRTAPSGAASFTVTAASCYTGGGDSDAFPRMAAKSPAIFLSLGDFPYIDNTTNSTAPYLNDWSSLVAESAVGSFLKDRVTSYVNSDHDGNADDYDGTASTQPFFLDAYRTFWPHYTLDSGTDDEIAHTFTWGRVRFVMLDVHTNRSPEGNTDNSSKTMLGTAQKAWLKDVLLDATEPVIVLNVVEPWIEDTGDDGWGIYTTERTELAQYIADNDLTDKIIIIHGDAHMLTYDNGTNNDYGTGWPPGPPVFCFAPLDRTNSTKGGPYSGGTWLANEQQYGEMVFTDDGTTVTVNVRGYSVTSSTTETQRFDVELEFTLPHADGTIGLALGATGAVSKVANVTGSISLGLAATGAASKTAGTSGSIELAVTANDDAAKTAAAGGGIPLTLDAAGAAAKIVGTLGEIALALELTAAVTTTTSDERNVTGAITLGLLAEGVAAKTGNTAGALGLQLLIDAVAAKDAAAAGALALALAISGDDTKLGAVAGSLGLTLDMLGTVSATGEDETLGTLALALSIAAVASKAVSTTGALTLGLGLTGTVGATKDVSGALALVLAATGAVTVATPGQTNGSLGVTLGATGAATKTGNTIGSLSLVLGLVGAIVGATIPGRLLIAMHSPELVINALAPSLTITAEADA